MYVMQNVYLRDGSGCHVVFSIMLCVVLINASAESRLMWMQVDVAGLLHFWGLTLLGYLLIE